MIQNYMQQSTKKVLHTLELAVSELVSLRMNVLTPDFILLALLSQPDSEATRILEHELPAPQETVATLLGQIRQHYQQAVQVQTTEIVTSQELAEVFRIAWEEAKKAGDDYVSTGTLFIALFDSKADYAADLLKQTGMSAEQARQALKEIRGGHTISTEDAEPPVMCSNVIRRT